jgi:hypothetical protein
MAKLTNQQTIKHPTANKPIKTSTQMTKHANYINQQNNKHPTFNKPIKTSASTQLTKQNIIPARGSTNI